jgi:hypothetical protein
MDLRLAASRSGLPACRAGEAWLHSPVDPAREAERFASAALGGGRPPLVVILGPCLDYLGAAVRTLLPRATIVSIQHSDFFKGREVAAADRSWYPDSGSKLEAFLDSALDEDSISGLAVMSWPPAAAAFPEESRAAAAALRSSLDRLASSSATVKAFGRRWIANACRGFLLAESAARLREDNRPVVVAAAGPTLAASLTELAPMRGSFMLAAVSSALAACEAAGLEPDLAVATDGGNWSRLHLYPISSRRLPIAAPLGALPSASLSRGTSFLFIDQGGFAETELLKSIGCPASSILALPPHGTVSGTAVFLASRITTGPIIAAGLDLASLGDIDHARPHGFDGVSSSGSRRLRPEEGARWSRAVEAAPIALPAAPWRTSRSLSAYASGLDASMHNLRGRLFRLNPSPVPLPAFEDIDAARARELIGCGASASPAATGGDVAADGAAPLPSRALREPALKSALRDWRSLAGRASEGLASGQLVSEGRVAELLRSIDIVDYAAARRAIMSGGDPSAAAAELGRRAEAFLRGLEETLVP